MTKLSDYHHFSGRHWETGSVCNFLAYRGITAPHSGQSYSEALLLGISGGERDTYADFLAEASTILSKPGLLTAADGFREAAQGWEALGKALLPDEIEPLGRIRRLMLQRETLFRTQGGAAQEDIRHINAEIKSLKVETGQNSPLSGSSLQDFLENLRARIQDVADIERPAVQVLQSTMAI